MNQRKYVDDIRDELIRLGGHALRQDVIEAVRIVRQRRGEHLPRSYSETIQSSFNQYSVTSDEWKKRGSSNATGWFRSAGGKGSGFWALSSFEQDEVDRLADEWHNRPQPPQKPIPLAVDPEIDLGFLSGFGNHFATEAVPGALPVGRNSPQRPAFGLYAEQLSGTAFTMARSENRRSWLYRLRPSAPHGAFTLALDPTGNRSLPANPNRLRWDPRPLPDAATSFHDSVMPVLWNGDPEALTGVTVSTYAATQSMGNQAFFSADGEMLIIPERGRLRLLTEMGIIDLEPLEIAIIPRGVRYRVELPDGPVRGYLCENHGAPFRLPDLGPIGSNGLANPRDFESPAAWFEDRDEPFELVQKFGGKLWTTTLPHSPFDVVAWHGNLAPVKYDLRRFNTLGTVSYDHPDPSIFTVLTSPSDMPGRANADFVIFPPRWMVAEDSFRPPWFHRNLMSEAMGLITGAYDAKAGGFSPGGLSLHNMMSAHGPDAASWQAATVADLKPHKIDGTMAFMIESCWPYRVTDWAMARAQPDYDAVWAGFPKARV